jgi:uncharacterized protein YifN (PemK superfamily)
VLVVPLSTTAPKEPRTVHVKLKDRYSFLAAETWAKCDLVAHVARHRLDRVYSCDRGFLGRNASQLTNRDFVAMQSGLLHAISLARLAPILHADLDTTSGFS